MITTVSDSQTEILLNIQKLHNNDEPFQADLTYSTGNFWRGMPYEPKIKMDLAPGLGNVQGDLRRLPFKTHSLRSAVIDPPFIHAAGKDSIIGQRFGSYPSQQALRDLYRATLSQLNEVLPLGGLVVWKCQDIVESGKQVWTHINLGIDAQAFGYGIEDLFILTKKGQIAGHNHANQVHARRAHSYFMVLRVGGPITQSMAKRLRGKTL